MSAGIDEEDGITQDDTRQDSKYTKYFREANSLHLIILQIRIILM